MTRSRLSRNQASSNTKHIATLGVSSEDQARGVTHRYCKWFYETVVFLDQRSLCRMMQDGRMLLFDVYFQYRIREKLPNGQIYRIAA
jgi:hypothetical protein